MKLPRFFKKEEFRPTQLPLPGERRRRQIRQTEPGGRKAIFILFLATFLLSGLFLLWGKTSEKKEEPIRVLKEAGPAPTASEESREKTIAKVREKTRGLQGEYGFYVYNLVGRYQYGDRQNKVFQAASLIKLPVMLALYQEAEAGRLDLEEKYTLQNEDKLTGAGSLQHKPAGTVVTYRQLARSMGKQSDNTAFGIVRKKLGDEKIEETIKALGMERTSLERNETSPYDIGLFFKKLYAGGVVSRTSRDEIIEALTETAFEDRIPAGVPEGVKVAHKIGTEAGNCSDAGIVFSSKPFVLVVMSKNASQDQALAVTPEITRIVFEAETS